MQGYQVVFLGIVSDGWRTAGPRAGDRLAGVRRLWSWSVEEGELSKQSAQSSPPVGGAVSPG